MQIFSRLHTNISRRSYNQLANLPILHIDNATFYREHPSTVQHCTVPNPALFNDLSFVIPSEHKKQRHWAIIGPSNAGKTTLLDVLRGKHFCIPPIARSFPYLASKEVEVNDARHRNPARAIQYVGFDGERGGAGKAGTRGAYMSARYESRLEDTDFSVMDYLHGNTDLNPAGAKNGKAIGKESLKKVVTDLRLEDLIAMPMGNLSNGQTRRARIARALLEEPLVLLLDEPFMGLDPPTITSLDPLLYDLAKANSPQLVLALRPQDPLPKWITHLVYLGAGPQILHQGARRTVLKALSTSKEQNVHYHWTPAPGIVAQRGLPRNFRDWRTITKKEGSMSRDGLPMKAPDSPPQSGEPLVEIRGVCVKYGDKPALGSWHQNVDGEEKEGLWWTVKRGERWGIFGPNGSGKTTLLSLICSDHPQTYSLPVTIFGRGRLPQPGRPGISIFDIQARIGHSSPEIHAFFPRNLSLRQTVENAWAETFLGTPRLTYENDVTVDSCLSWFEAELNPAFVALDDPIIKGTLPPKPYYDPSSTAWADDIRFGDAPFSAQRVALFLRAVVKKPDLVVLDEAFSGMDSFVRDKCMLFLAWGETKSFAIANTKDGSRKRFVIDTEPALLSEKVFEGLNQEQALLCVSHVRDEVPGIVKDWMSLPEATSDQPARFGKFKGPLEGDGKAWEHIWRF